MLSPALLSVMTSSGMYDYAENGFTASEFPPKAASVAAIVAALPIADRLGTFSPRLDGHGNSVRGLKVCEALSARFDLHMLNRSAELRTCIICDYDIYGISSRVAANLTRAGKYSTSTIATSASLNSSER